MTRYFLHARGPNRYVADYKGLELPGIGAAYDIAVRTIRDVAIDPVGLRAHA
jgi:hypothetical protein